MFGFNWPSQRPQIMTVSCRKCRGGSKFAISKYTGRIEEQDDLKTATPSVFRITFKFF